MVVEESRGQVQLAQPPLRGLATQLAISGDSALWGEGRSAPKDGSSGFSLRGALLGHSRVNRQASSAWLISHLPSV